MPGAGDDSVFDLAFAQRASLMQTQIIDSEELTVQSKNGEGPPTHDGHPAGARRKAVDRPDSYKGRQ